MAQIYQCNACSRRFSISEKTFNERIAGKSVSLRCKHCRGLLVLDPDDQGDATTGDGAPASAPASRPIGFIAEPSSAPNLAWQRGLRLPNTAASAVKQSRLARGTARTESAVQGSSTSKGAECEASELEAAAPQPEACAQDSSPVAPNSQTVTPELRVEPIQLDPMPVLSVQSEVLVGSSSVADQYDLEGNTECLVEPTGNPDELYGTSRPTLLGCGPGPSLAPRHQASLDLPGVGQPSESEITPPATIASTFADWSLPLPDKGGSSNFGTAAKPIRRSRRVWFTAMTSALLAIVALAYWSRQRTTIAHRPVAESALVRPNPAAQLGSAPSAETLVAQAAPGRPAATPAPQPANPPPQQSAPEQATGDVPAYVSKGVVAALVGVGIRRATRCHPNGHAVGKSRISITFSPKGRAVDARIDDEPLASAPVSRCILERVRSIVIPRFDGASFTYTTSITMR